MSETQAEGPAQPAPGDVTSRLAALEARAAAAEQHAADLAAELKAKTEEIAELAVTRLPGHFLHLADGQVIESEGAVPTHVSVPDGTPEGKTVPVVHAFDR